MIILTSANKSHINSAINKFKGNHFHWVFLGDDVARGLLVERWIDDFGTRINIGDKLQRAAQTFREPYIEYIGKLGSKNNSAYWWLSSLSEKNAYLSKVFLYCCYIAVCKEILTNYEKRFNDLLIIVNENAIRKALVKNIKDTSRWIIIPKYQIQDYKLYIYIKYFSEAFLKRGWFLSIRLYKIFISRYVYKFNKKDYLKNRLFALHSWIDHRSFTKNSKYRSNNYGNLSEQLKVKGYNAIVVPRVLPTIGYKTAIKHMANAEEYFLVMEAFLKITDIAIAPIKWAIKTFPLKKSWPYLNGLDVEELIYDEQWKNWAGNRGVDASLYFYIVKNWKKNGLEIDNFVYTYENQIIEKAFCLAFNKFYPETKKIAYQHCGFSKMQLNFFISSYEINIAPMPDRWVTGGDIYDDLFRASNYAPEKIVCSNAIRYEYLFNKVRKNDRSQMSQYCKKPCTILVACSLGKNQTLELVSKVLKAFKNNKTYQIIIKPHPSTPFELSKDLMVDSLPENIQISNESMEHLLEISDIFLYTDTTSVFEALFMGIQPIHISSDYSIDIDFLDLKPELRFQVRTPEELLSTVNKLTESGSNSTAKDIRISDEVLSKFIRCITGESYRAFI
jgi:hypothetical protein